MPLEFGNILMTLKKRTVRDLEREGREVNTLLSLFLRDLDY